MKGYFLSTTSLKKKIGKFTSNAIIRGAYKTRNIFENNTSNTVHAKPLFMMCQSCTNSRRNHFQRRNNR